MSTVKMSAILHVARLQGLSDDDLRKEAERFIWLSAFTLNNPRSAYHRMVDMIYDEAQRREKPSIYTVAYDNVHEDNFGRRPNGTERGLSVSRET